MKCPEIKEIQDDPNFNYLFYRERLKEAHKKIKTDDIFGPIMKLAVEDYREANALERLDFIDAKTLAHIINNSKPAETPKTPVEVPAEKPAISTKPELATKNTKF